MTPVIAGPKYKEPKVPVGSCVLWNSGTLLLCSFARVGLLLEPGPLLLQSPELWGQKAPSPLMGHYK